MLFPNHQKPPTEVSINAAIIIIFYTLGSKDPEG